MARFFRAAAIGVGLSLPSCSLLVSTDHLVGPTPSSVDASDAAPIDGSAIADATSDGADGGAASYQATVLADKPSAYWRLEETTGSTAKDETGNHPGIYHGHGTLGVAGIKPGTRAARFNGVDSYVEIGDVLGFANGAPFTLEAWVSPDVGGVVSTFRDVIAKIVGTTNDAGDVTTFAGYSMAYEAAGFRFFLCQDEQGPCVSPKATPPVEGAFTHLVSVFDGATATIFFNGDVVAAQPLPDKKLPKVGVALRIGSEQNYGYLLGVIDEVAVYDYALPPARIRAHYLAAPN